MASRILIVDDSGITRALIKRAILLSKHSVDAVLEAGNGKEALEIVRRDQIDLLIADLNMPEMSGTALTQAVLGDPLTRHIPVVIVSANPDPSVQAELKNIGVAGYIRKPFTPEAIRDVLNHLLGELHA